MPEETSPIITVVLVNRALPYNCVGKLTGRSGVEYGHSVYEEAHGAHVCRMPLAQWRACKQDVTYGFTRRWAQWEVDFEIKEEGGSPEGTCNHQHLDRRLGGRMKNEEDGGEVGKDESENRREDEACGGRAEGKEILTAETLAGVTNFRRLLAMAKRIGVIEPERIDTSEGMREAILTAQEVRP